MSAGRRPGRTNRRLWHWRSRAQEAECAKNTAYGERDRLVAALSKCFPSFLARHPAADAAWEDDWRWIVFVELPTGQASWHIHDSELSWFRHLPVRDGEHWDGHTTEEKYERVERLEDGAAGAGAAGGAR